MQLFSRFSFVISALVLSMTPLSVFADGASLAKDQCAGCHTESGNSDDEKIPNIAGFSATTTNDIFTTYKEGDRIGAKYKPEGGDETDMNEIAKGISESDLKLIAQYYAGKKFENRSNKTDPKLVKAGAKLHEKNCDKCHSDGGTNAEDDAAILSGQWMAYLRKEFKNIKSGDRIMPKKMMKKMEKLDDDEIESLIHYYAAGQ